MTMEKILFPDKKNWEQLTQRPISEKTLLIDVVSTVFADVQNDGDKAVLKYSQLFDKVDIKTVAVGNEEIKTAGDFLSPELKNSITLAKANIEKFHTAQAETPTVIETTTGVFCWRENRAIEKVGLYIPGGSAPLFSTVLMLGIPAQLANCKEIILCSPPDATGKINAAILYTAALIGITKIFCVGGIQAIAALTFGTEIIPAVYKIFGPGNQYVTAAKQYAQSFGVAIDMPAGPSEVLVIADETSDPAFVAADLLSQAEHGADSQVVLLTTNEKILHAIINEIDTQLKHLPRKDLAEKALNNSKAILLNNVEECISFSNSYAPEHLILAIKEAKYWLAKITNAGSVFLGHYSCESVGDYASGTNHTLPTNGYARNYSGVSLDSFVKKITVQELTKNGIKNIGRAVEVMAEAEGLHAHKNAVTVRLESLKNN
jgi:histidinol dehydrogenase